MANDNYRTLDDEELKRYTNDRIMDLKTFLDSINLDSLSRMGFLRIMDINTCEKAINMHTTKYESH